MEKSYDELEDQTESEAVNKEKAARNVMLAHLGMLLAGTIYGGLNVITSKALVGVNPTVFALYRNVGSSLYIAAQWLTFEGFQKPKSTADALHFFSLGLTGIFLFTVGISKTSADVASIFQPAIPVFAALVAMISGLEPPIWPKSCNEVGNYTMRKILGILLAVLGSMIMVGFNNISHGQGIVGDLCLIGNTFCFGVYFCLQKPLLKRYGPLTVTAYAYLSGALCMICVSMYYVNDHSVWKIKKMELYGLIYAWVGSDGINGVLMTWCNQYIPASICALYNMMQPITTAILAYVILHEGLVPRDAYGGILIIFGLCLCSLKTAAEHAEIKFLESEDLDLDLDNEAGDKADNEGQLKDPLLAE